MVFFLCMHTNSMSNYLIENKNLENKFSEEEIKEHLQYLILLLRKNI